MSGLALNFFASEGWLTLVVATISEVVDPEIKGTAFAMIIFVTKVIGQLSPLGIAFIF
jgi:hypothetical protein